MRLPGSMKLSNLQASLIVFTLMILIQVVYVIGNPKFSAGFGVEYHCIANSLLNGLGYANPFYPSITGPTAWMPPFLVYLNYFTFWLMGDSISAFVFLSLLKFLCYAVAFYYFLRILDLAGVKKNITLWIIIFLIYFLFSPSDNLGNIHDFWFPTLLMSLFIYHLIRLQQGIKKALWPLLVIFFVIPFSSPIQGLVFILVAGIVIVILPLFSSWISGNRIAFPDFLRKNLLFVILMGIAFGLSIGIWTLRNYRVFYALIPTKSNMWFEFYLSNIVDTDGQLSQSTLYRSHLTYREDLRDEMREMGEVAWLDQFHEIGNKYLEKHRQEYYRKIGYRLFNALVFIENDMDKIYSSGYSKFPEEDIQKLAQPRLFLVGFWISVFYSEEEMQNLLNRLNLSEPDVIFQDWLEAKSSYLNTKYSFANIVRSSSMALVPTLCILLLALVKKIRKNSVYYISLSIYILYLIPYLLISHQIRYQRPLFFLQAIMLYLLIVTIAGKWKRNRILPGN